MKCQLIPKRMSGSKFCGKNNNLWIKCVLAPGGLFPASPGRPRVCGWGQENPHLGGPLVFSEPAFIPTIPRRSRQPLRAAWPGLRGAECSSTQTFQLPLKPTGTSLNPGPHPLL